MGPSPLCVIDRRHRRCFLITAQPRMLLPTTGIVSEKQLGVFTTSGRQPDSGNKAAPHGHPSLMIVTSIQPEPCKKEQGDLINRLSILSKLNYARLHGYEFQLYTHVRRLSHAFWGLLVR